MLVPLVTSYDEKTARITRFKSGLATNTPSHLWNDDNPEFPGARNVGRYWQELSYDSARLHFTGIDLTPGMYAALTYLTL